MKDFGLASKIVRLLLNSVVLAIQRRAWRVKPRVHLACVRKIAEQLVYQ